MVDESYQTSDRTGDRSGWVLVDATFLQKALDVLRRTAEPKPCWWCRQPLVGPTCPRCDAESAS